MPNQDVTVDQLDRMEQVVTRPIYLVQLNHSGTVEYLSCSGDITFDSQVYVAGGAAIATINNSESATIVVPNSVARLDQIQNNDWLDGICVIYYIPALPSDGDSFALGDALLMLDGIIDSSGLRGESVNIAVRHKWLTGNMSPIYTFDQFCNHIPPAGSTLEWDNETVVLDSVYTYEDRQLVVGSQLGFAGQDPNWFDLFQYSTSA